MVKRRESSRHSFQQQQCKKDRIGGGEQQEISQCQREIIVSTWNLIREKTSRKGEVGGQTSDNAILLSAQYNSIDL